MLDQLNFPSGGGTQVATPKIIFADDANVQI